MKKDTRDQSGLTVGVDLGDRWSKYCVLDEQGQVLEEDTVATTGRALRKLFGDRVQTVTVAGPVRARSRNLDRLNRIGH